jgi:phospholipid transport system substrate-binding protein
MKKLLLIGVLFTLITTNLSALEKSNIKPYMSQSINKITYILSLENKAKEQKAKEIFNILDEVFDYKLMSRISLGRYYKKLSSSEKSKFTVAFQKKLKLSYMNKLNLYTNQKTKIKELKEIKKNRVMLYTDLIGDESVFAINYKFYKNKQNQWFIYDVELLGVSILQTYRKQFKEYLLNHTIADLTVNM